MNTLDHIPNSYTFNNIHSDNNPYSIHIAKCNSCNHENICKYKEDYIKLLESLNDTYNNFKNDKVLFCLNLDCKYYVCTDTAYINNNQFTIVANDISKEK